MAPASPARSVSRPGRTPPSRQERRKIWAASVCLALAGLLLGYQFGLFDRLTETPTAVSPAEQAAFEAAKKAGEAYEVKQRERGVPIQINGA